VKLGGGGSRGKIVAFQIRRVILERRREICRKGGLFLTFLLGALIIAEENAF
jgi:hypothetical protein